MAKNIIDLLEQQEAQARLISQTAAIISPAAIGDCLLTLPLASFIKQNLDIGTIDFIGRSDYIDFYPGRTSISKIRSIDSIQFHRLFAKSDDFHLEDGDPLISALSGYQLIVSFLGEQHSDFEDNLLFTINCSNAAEVIILNVKPPTDFTSHISSFYIDQFCQADTSIKPSTPFDSKCEQVKANPSDILCGREILQQSGLDSDQKTVAIHPGSGSKEKCWNLDNFLAVAEKLKSENIQVIFFIGPAELERFETIEFERIKKSTKYLSNLTLTQIMQLLAASNCYIGNDSGISHLAGLMGIKTLSIFGPTNHIIYAPLGPYVKTYVSDIEKFNAPCPSAQKEIFEIVSQMLSEE